MDVSSLMISNYKPFHCLLPPSRTQQRLPQYVSCQARKLGNEVEENITAINGTKNFYKILSLSPKTASMDEIKRAYRSMALRYHPDVCQDPLRKEESTRMFLQLHAAYETLSNPVLREEYDYELGLIKTCRRNNNGNGEEWRRRWEEQVVELRRRSNRRMAQKEGSSWGSRIRAQNIEKN